MGVSVHLVLALVFLGISAEQKNYKICSSPKDISDCMQVGRNEDVLCEQNYHGVDCLLNIEQGKADFGRVAPEEALIASNYVNNIVVLGEFRPDDAKCEFVENTLYKTVVLVRAGYTGGFKGLKGKRYCHPGFQFEEPVTELVLKEFEKTVLKANGIDGCSNKVDSNTLFEKELKALADFFGPSCRPGPWTDLTDLNNKYYQQYSKLCELCNSGHNCTQSPAGEPFMQSLDCLIKNGGDVALTTVDTINKYFNKTENMNSKADYKYLCRDETLSPLDKPCSWSKQPWNLIIANKDKAEVIKADLEQWFSRNIVSCAAKISTETSEFEKSLQAILFPTDKVYNRINFTDQLVPLSDYMKKYRVIPTVRDSEMCNQDLKWCTISNEEQQKCLWLAQASVNHAIQPVINCVQSPSKLSCLEDIKNNKADVVTSDAHYGYIARRKNLAALAYPETKSSDRINTIIVIKKDNDLGYKHFGNLRNKKACFPEYGGIEWLSFITVAREHGVLSKTTCDYGELISEFVADSCMPGAHDKEHEKTANTDDAKLCKLCVPDPYYAKTATTCNSDMSNKYYGNEGALKCLASVGDYAVITSRDYDSKVINDSNFQVVCKNGSLASHTGFKVDADCVLTTVIDSEVVSKRDNPKNEDIRLALLNFEKRFGTDRVKAFEIFNVFNSTLDLLFKDSTPGLDTVYSNNKYIKKYVDLISHIDQCSKDGNSAATAQTVTIPILSILALIVLLK